MPRRAARQVVLEDILSTTFETDDGSLIGPVLRGHLALEALLADLLINKDSAIDPWKKNFPSKTQLAMELDLIDQNQKKAFDRFNDFRNDFAHIFGLASSAMTVHSLAAELEGYGIDFSDSVGRQSLAEATEAYGGELGLLGEVVWCLLYEVAFALMEAGGRDLFSADST